MWHVTLGWYYVYQFEVFNKSYQIKASQNPVTEVRWEIIKLQRVIDSTEEL